MRSLNKHNNNVEILGMGCGDTTHCSCGGGNCPTVPVKPCGCNKPSQDNNYTVMQPAMAGFFSWLRKAVNKIVVALEDVIPFSSILIDFTDGDGHFFGAQTGTLCRFAPDATQCRTTTASIDYPLTPEDEQMLDDYTDYTFLPFFKPYLSKIKGFISNPPSYDAFVDYYNKAQQFIAYLKWYQNYVITAGEGDFSRNALLTRNEYFNIQIALLEDSIEKYITSTGVRANAVSKNTTIDSELFSELQFNAPKTVAINPKEITLQTVSGGNEVLVSNPQLVDGKSKIKMKHILGFGLLAYVGYRIFKK